jgi:hypothetical protein
LLFKKGDPKPANGGRKAGTPNRRTVEVRQVIQQAAHQIGGVDRLIAWIKADPENEKIFWAQMYLKLLPIRVMGSGEHGEIELNIRIAQDELARRLEERGLPTFILGSEKPLLDDATPVSCDAGSNGSDAPMLDQSGDGVL